MFENPGKITALLSPVADAHAGGLLPTLSLSPYFAFAEFKHNYSYKLETDRYRPTDIIGRYLTF